METTVELQKNFIYQAWPLAITLLLFLFLTFWIVKWCVELLKERAERKKLQKVAKQQNFVAQPRKVSPRAEYTEKLQLLKKAVQHGEISEREGYQTCSIYIREFVSKMTGYDLTTVTLMEIEKLRMPRLTELIRSYYEPEFAENAEGNAAEAIERAKRVIEQWK